MSETKLEELTSRINELNNQRDEIKKEVLQLVKERETLEATNVWGTKIDDMNDAQVEALEQALAAAKNKPKAQVVTAEPIETEEIVGVIGGDLSPIAAPLNSFNN